MLSASGPRPGARPIKLALNNKRYSCPVPRTQKATIRLQRFNNFYGSEGGNCSSCYAYGQSLVTVPAPVSARPQAATESRAATAGCWPQSSFAAIQTFSERQTLRVSDRPPRARARPRVPGPILSQRSASKSRSRCFSGTRACAGTRMIRIMAMTMITVTAGLVLAVAAGRDRLA